MKILSSLDIREDADVDGTLSQADDAVIDSGESSRVVVYDDTGAAPTSGAAVGTVFIGYDIDG